MKRIKLYHQVEKFLEEKSITENENVTKLANNAIIEYYGLQFKLEDSVASLFVQLEKDGIERLDSLTAAKNYSLNEETILVELDFSVLQTMKVNFKYRHATTNQKKGKALYSLIKDLEKAGIKVKYVNGVKNIYAYIKFNLDSPLGLSEDEESKIIKEVRKVIFEMDKLL